MIQEMFSYLNVAENMFWYTDSYQKSDMYNSVLHALVKAKEVCGVYLYFSLFFPPVFGSVVGQGGELCWGGDQHGADLI